MYLAKGYILSRNESNGKIVGDYLRKYGNTMTKLALARLIYKENPEYFSNVECVRAMIRYRTHNWGKNKNLTDEFVGFCQPKSEAIERVDFQLPKTATNCLLLSDIHVPYHDTKAVDVALKFGVEKKVNTIVLCGDFMDFYGLSKFENDPRERELRYELDCGYEMIGYISSLLPNSKIYYLPGNHEFRYESYLRRKAPELLQIEPELAKLDTVLHFSDFGLEYLRFSQIIKAGKLFIGHGHEFGGGAGGVNPGRTFFLRSYSNFIGGHFHKTSENIERRLNGSMVSNWSMGCLCGLWPEYAKYNKWNHGFAWLRIDNGEFKLFNARIDNGKLY